MNITLSTGGLIAAVCYYLLLFMVWQRKVDDDIAGKKKTHDQS